MEKNEELKSSAVSDIEAQASVSPREPLDISTVMRDFALYCHSQLRSNPLSEAALYVSEKWKLNNKNVIQLGLGFCGEDQSFLKHLLKSHQYTTEDLLKADVIRLTASGKAQLTMKNGIVIPIISVNGHIVGFDHFSLSRKIVVHHCGHPPCLYSCNIAVKSNKKSVIITSSYEAYFELFSKGLTNVVMMNRIAACDEQLEALKERFKAVITISDQKITSVCAKFCAANDIFCDQCDLRYYNSGTKYINKNLKNIIYKVDSYERIFG